MEANSILKIKSPRYVGKERSSSSRYCRIHGTTQECESCRFDSALNSIVGPDRICRVEDTDADISGIPGIPAIVSRRPSVLFGEEAEDSETTATTTVTALPGVVIELILSLVPRRRNESRPII